MKEVIEWFDVVKRPLTDEEKKQFDDDVVYILDGHLPDDGDEILIFTKWGVDTDVADMSDDGCYLEKRGDWDDVIAWANMPKCNCERREEASDDRA